MSVTCCVPALSLRIVLLFAWSAVVTSVPEFPQLKWKSRFHERLHLTENIQDVVRPQACDGVWSGSRLCREKVQLHIADRAHELFVPVWSGGSSAPILELPGKVWKFVHHDHGKGNDSGERVALGAIDNRPATETPPHTYGRNWIWIVCLLVSLGLAAGFLWWYAAFQTETKPHDEKDDLELLVIQGRPCWNYFCAIFCIKATCLVFWLTYALVCVENESIRENPHRNITSESDSTLQPGEVKTVLLQTIDPGRSAYLASLGIMLSLIVAFMTLANWTRGMTEINKSLLIQFMLRGASLSICVAVVLECIGQTFLNKKGLIAQTAASSGKVIGLALLMLLVGFSEEFAKLISATCGTSLSPTRVSYEKIREGCCHKNCCHVWVTSPRALALAGLASGFGFMALENVEYILAVVMKPPAIPEGIKEDEDAEYSEGVTVVVTMIVIAVRVLLNLHPWLAGLSALRIGRTAFQAEPTTACLKTDVLIWACLPSALIHAAYDFIVQAWPFLAVVAAPCMWYYSRWLFIQSFQEECNNVDGSKEGQNEDTPSEAVRTA